jgi:FkbM family methyltransferase
MNLGSLNQFLIWVLSCVGGRLCRLGERLSSGARFYELQRWRHARGDFTLRMDYALNANAVVWDVGGYEGQWASDITARFACSIQIFEPMPDATIALRRRFAANPLIHVHAYALGGRNGRLPLSLAGDGSSLARGRETSRVIEVAVRDVVAVWTELATRRVDLLKLNIEGGEYELLERIIEAGLISSVMDIQIQFHDFVPDARERRARLSAALSITHERTWCYEFVWENWRRRAGVGA